MIWIASKAFVIAFGAVFTVAVLVVVAVDQVDRKLRPR